MAPKRWVRVARLLVIPLIAVLLAGGFAQVTFGLMDALGQYDPGLPFAAITAAADAQVAPGALAATRTSRRLLLVVVDGLRADTSEKMPFLNELRKTGFSGTLVVGQPSYSKPGYAAIATGARQEVTGVILNDHQGRTPAETIFAVAAQAGLKTAAVADDWWQELVGPDVTFPHYYADAVFDDPATDENTYAAARQSLQTEQADLTLVHFAQTDAQAHESGGAASPQYLAAALHIDELIRGLAAVLDLSRDTIVVTADHGHLARNLGPGTGHGGWEPEVLAVPLVAAGAGISQGMLAAPEAAVDLTPTVAALLGLPVPAESQGRIIFPMLDLSDSTRATLAAARAERLIPFAAAYEKKFGVVAPATADADLQAAEAALRNGDYATAYDRAEAYTSRTLAAMAAARDAAVRHGRWARLPGALAALAVLFLAVFLLTRRRTGAVAQSGGTATAGTGGAGVEALSGRAGWSPGMFLAGSGLYLLVDFAVYRGLMGGTYSLGALPGADVPSLLPVFAWPSYVGVMVVAAWFWFAARHGHRSERVWAVEKAVAAAIAGDAFFVILVLWWTGTDFRLLLPDFHVAFVAMAHLLKVTFLAIPAVVLPLVAAVIPGWGRAAAPAGHGATRSVR